MTIEIRTTVCEIFQIVWRSSQIIYKTQKCMHPHTCLGTQIRNVPRNWCQKQGSAVFILTSLMTKKCEVCKRTKMTRSLCRRRTGGALLRAEKFGDFRTADHKALNVDGESTEQSMVRCRCSRSCHSMVFNPFRAKPKLRRRRKGVYESMQTIHLNLANLVMIYHESSNLNTSKGTSAVLLRSGLDGKWWADSMECYCYLRNVQYLMGKHHMKDDLENHSNGQ